MGGDSDSIKAGLWSLDGLHAEQTAFTKINVFCTTTEDRVTVQRLQNQ